jgi:DNA polymerase delta subunit 2
MKVLCLEHGVEQIAIGTLYKDMKLKPTVLKEYTEDATMAQQLSADTFCDDTDGLVLEDDSARIKLTGDLDTDSLVSGIILAVKGILDEKAGIFSVTGHCFAGMAPLTPTALAYKCSAYSLR